MYEQHFGLTRNPFSMTPEPALLYMTPGHREALAGLAYAILERKGFAMLTGEAGTGKSTLLARMLQHLPATRVISSVILNPTLTESEFLEMALLDFGFASVPVSKAQRLVQFQEFLLRTRQAEKIAVLVIDEAHKLAPSVLEEVRLLSNLELPGEKLLQIVLAGQDELLEVLGRTELRQISQRISVRLTLSPLAPADIEQYIALRWSKAGAQAAPPFAREAYPEIALWSRGIPRLVNALCDNAIMTAFSEKPPIVASRHVREAARDLGLIPAAMARLSARNGARPVPAPAPAQRAARKEDVPSRGPVALRRVPQAGERPEQPRFSKWMTRLGIVRQGAQ
jgi:general secretion pathway protein A